MRVSGLRTRTTLEPPACAGDPVQVAMLKGLCAGSVNTAVVLGPRGEELFVHQKLTQFGREFLETGRVFQTLATPLGHLGVLICLDCFQDPVSDRIRQSPATVLLVPSMSNTISAHESKARERRADGIATLVSNWWLDKEVGRDGASRAWVPGQDPVVARGLHRSLRVQLVS